MRELNAKLKALLKKAGIPHEEILVFGPTRTYVHVRCVGKSTAQEWAHLLKSLFPEVRVSVVPTAWEARANRGTCLRPTMRRGWLVSLMGA